MIGVREIAEGDIPNSNFVNDTFVYTHGYGITAVSVNQIGRRGRAGHPGRQGAAPAGPLRRPAGARLRRHRRQPRDLLR